MRGDELSQAITQPGKVVLFAGVKEEPVAGSRLDAMWHKANLYLE